MASLSSVVILRHLAFAKILKVDFLLFRVAGDNMEVELVDKNALSLGFVAVFVEIIVC